jgi:hypothetical protein
LDWTRNNGDGVRVPSTRDANHGEVFVGIVCSHLDPAPHLAGTGLLVPMGSLHQLDATTSDPRGGCGVGDLAVGDLLTTGAGDEPVVTTLAGDLFVFAAPAAGGDRTVPRNWLAAVSSTSGGRS